MELYRGIGVQYAHSGGQRQDVRPCCARDDGAVKADEKFKRTVDKTPTVKYNDIGESPTQTYRGR